MQHHPDPTVPAYRRLVTGLNRDGPGVHIRRPEGSGDHLLMYTLEGRGFFRGKGHESALPGGSVVLLPEGMPHDYGNALPDTPWTLLWTHFHPWPHWDELLRWTVEPSGAGVIHLDDTALLERMESDLRLMHRTALTGHPHRELLAMNALERALLTCAEAHPARPAGRLDERIQAAMDRMHARMAEPLTVEGLAGAVGLSPSRFAHLFKEQTGIPPLRYLEARRVERACDLLARTVRPVGEIAAEVGFPDPFYFSRTFRKVTGHSPRAFRELNPSAGSGQAGDSGGA